jgi:hypothetical protein
VTVEVERNGLTEELNAKLGTRPNSNRRSP